MAYYLKNRISFVCVLWLIAFNLHAQVPILERNISLRVNNDKLSEVLDLIAKEGGFNFAYPSNLIDVNRRIDLTLTDRPVRDVLKQLFSTSLIYKVRGQYVILQKNTAESQNTHFILSGYVVDPREGVKLPDASIYEKNSLISTITNQYGFYKIKLSTRKFPIRLSVSKPGYEPEIILIKNAQNDYQNIELRRIKKPFVFEPTIEDNSMEKMDAFKSNVQALERPTLLDNSRPLLLDQIDELESSIAIEPDSIQYVSNWDKFKKSIETFFVRRSQRINAMNINDSLNRRFQVSLLPFLGTNRLLSGSIENDFSLNILVGFSAGVRKMEIGGLLNGVRHNVTGFQLAGVGNIVGGELLGVQMSSLFNLTESIQRGVQLSTGINVVTQVSNGWQMGLINFANEVQGKGHQIGLINISEFSETTPIGLLSFVSSSDGYKRLELSIDENQTGSFIFKTGVKKFYNVLAIGYNFLRANEVFSAGYGVGRAYELKNSWMFNTDITANVLVEYNDFTPNVGNLWRLDLSFEKQVSRNAAITFGPSFKALFLNTYNSATWKGKPFTQMPPYPPLFSTHYTTFWLGFQMGLRIRSQ
jgi:hypothetical protein